NSSIFPLTKKLKIAYIALGDSVENTLGKLLKDSLHANTFYFNYRKDSLDALRLLKSLNGKYNLVIIGLHGYAKYPANNFGISPSAIMLAKTMQAQVSTPVLTMDFGNPYAIGNFCTAKNLVACYEDDAIFQSAAFDWLMGKFKAEGKLPVTVCPEYRFGFGM
ncbi:MAG: serine hydrolase, partial [Chitinophagaceae bacterium]